MYRNKSVNGNLTLSLGQPYKVPFKDYTAFTTQVLLYFNLQNFAGTICMDSWITFISLLSPRLAALLFQVSFRTHDAYATSAGLLHLCALSPEFDQSMDNFFPTWCFTLSVTGGLLTFLFSVNSLPLKVLYFDVNCWTHDSLVERIFLYIKIKTFHIHVY